jgi:hypothetical protein
MKDLGKTKFCGLQIEHFPNGIIVHQSTYTEKVLKHFYIEKAHPLSTSVVVRVSFEVLANVREQNGKKRAKLVQPFGRDS